jgi:hypothetical protein
MRYRSTLLLLALLLAALTHAQDTLFYTNGDRIIGQVEEVGTDAVRYRTSSGANTVVIVVNKADLERLHLASGQSFVFNERGTGAVPSDAFMHRTKMLSVDFLSPALDHFTLGYEMLLRPRMSLAVKAGYIGLGQYGPNDNTTGQRGGLLKVGVSFILPPARRRIAADREAHPLAGWYLRPEIIVNSWGEDRYVYDYIGGSTTQRDKRSDLCLNVVIGRKVVLGERWTFDLYGGLGYGMQWLNGELTGDQYYNTYYTSSGRSEYAYSHAFFGSRSPLMASGGMMFGYLF